MLLLNVGINDYILDATVADIESQADQHTKNNKEI